MIDRLVQERRNSSALAMELRLSCINPSTWYLMIIYLQINTNLQWRRRMIVMASQITGNSTVCSINNLLWLTSKKRSKLCTFVRGIHGWLVDFPNKWYRKHSHGISHSHYDDVIMTMLASQITSLAVIYSIVYSGVNQRKHQSSASLAFVREIHRGPVNFPHKWPVTRKMFPFDDVIMVISLHKTLKKKHHSLLMGTGYEWLVDIWGIFHHLWVLLTHSTFML